jgi:hypothetical protein
LTHNNSSLYKRLATIQKTVGESRMFLSSWASPALLRLGTLFSVAHAFSGRRTNAAVMLVEKPEREKRT